MDTEITVMRSKLFRLSQAKGEQLARRLAELLRGRDEIVFVYLYGSFAENLPFHDIDLGIYTIGIKEEESTSYGLALGQELSEKVQVPVDVCVLNFAPVSFVYHVIRGHLIFDRNEELRTHIVGQVVQKYLDLKPMIYKGIKEAFGV
jgi:predicted nucleotidyltransferase